MSPHRIRAVARRIATQFRRDRRSLALLIVAPVLILSLVGALWGGPSDREVRVIAAEDRPVPAPILAGLRRTEGLAVATAPLEVALASLRDGVVDAVVHTRVGTVSTELVVSIDGSDQFRAGTVLGLVQRGIAAGAFGGGAPGAAGSPLRVERLHLEGSDRVLDGLAPLLVGLFAFFFTFLLATVSFLRERTTGTLERLLASPLRRAEIVLGYLAGFTLFGLVQAAVIVLFTAYVLGVRYEGHLGAIFLIEALLVVVAVSIGLFVSAFARNELQAVQFIPVVVVPQVFLSGLLVPVGELPDLLRPLAYALPLTYANEALRLVMIKGLPLGDPAIVRDLAVLAAFAAVTAAGAALSIRREVA